jgi:hypothetical protein
MNESLITVLLWMPAIFALAAYLVTRRRLTRSRSMVLFDCFTVALDVSICAFLFWREITGHIDPAVWGDERLLFPWLVPLWASIITVPFLLFAAIVRYLVFSHASLDTTRAV